MAKKESVKKSKKVNEIRVTNIPKALFDRITEDAKAEERSNGKQVLIFLKQNY